MIASYKAKGQCDLRFVEIKAILGGVFIDLAEHNLTWLSLAIEFNSSYRINLPIKRFPSIFQ